MQSELEQLTHSLGALSIQNSSGEAHNNNNKKKHIYVLECAGGVFYVGKTEKDVAVRFEEHLAGAGSAWTNLNTVRRIIETVPDGPFLEDAKTLEYMRMHGVDNVRGGKYSQTVLSQAERDEIERSMRHENNQCMQCGATSHFVAQCPSRQPKTAKQPALLVSVAPKKVACGGGGHSKSLCYRCGRNTHWVADCRARTHLNGTPL